MIWQRIPETMYVSLTQLKLGVYDNVSNFIIMEEKQVFFYLKR